MQMPDILLLTKIGRLPKKKGKVATRLQFLFLMLGNHDSLYFAIIHIYIYKVSFKVTSLSVLRMLSNFMFKGSGARNTSMKSSTLASYTSKK